jgi:hypothetical protein
LLGDYELQLDGGEVTLKGICSGLLLLPHEGNYVFVLTADDGEGRDKGEGKAVSELEGSGEAAPARSLTAVARPTVAPGFEVGEA